MCVDIDTTTDTTVEDDECFTVVLSSFLGEEVLVLNPANTTVCIHDDGRPSIYAKGINNVMLLGVLILKHQHLTVYKLILAALIDSEQMLLSIKAMSHMHFVHCN